MAAKPGSGKPSPGDNSPKRASWRSGKTTTKAANRAWQQNAATKVNQAAQQHNFKRSFAVATLMLLFVALCVSLYIYLTWRPQKVPLIVLSVTDYDLDRLPANAFASDDLARLNSLDASEMVAVHSTNTLGTDRDSALTFLKQQLKTRSGGPGGQTLIVYISTHGVVGYPAASTPSPCLLLSNDDPYDSSRWLPLTEVLALLGELDASVHKLLILDAGRIRSQWQIGQLYNGFADLLTDAVQSAAVPNLVVLNSAGPGEINWAAPELQGSVFGHFVSLGLSGAADEAPTGDADGVVSLHELNEYVTSNVAQWTRSHRADVQQPMLIAAGDDSPNFPVTFASAPEDRPTLQQQPEDPRWTEMQELWHKHSQLADSNVARVDPLGWEIYQHSLLKMEEAIDAGTAYAARYNQLKGKVEQLASHLAETGEEDLPAINFPLASAVQNARAREAQASSPTDAESAKSYWPAARRLWESAMKGPGLQRADLRRQLAALDQTGNRPTIEPVEVHFLRMVERFATAEAFNLTGLLQRAANARQTAEHVSFPTDPRVQYALYASAEQGDILRRKAEDKYFIGSPQALIDAERLWKESESKFAQAQKVAERLTAAYEVRDRAYRELPYLAQWMLACADDRLATSERAISLLVSDVHELARMLDLPAEVRSDDAIEKLQTSVAERLQQLKRAYLDECDNLRTQAAGSGVNIRSMHIALSIPLLTGAERVELRSKYLNLIQQNIERFGLSSGSAAGEEPAQDGRLNSFKVAEHPAVTFLTRLKVAQGLLNPANSYLAETLHDKTPEQLAALSDDVWVNILSAQGEQVRQLLAELKVETEKQSSETDEAMQSVTSPSPIARAGRSKADRLLRAAAPIKGIGPWRANDKRPDPIRELRQLDLHNLVFWQAARAVEDFWGPRQPGQPPYFVQAVDLCLQAARNIAPEGTAIREPLASLVQQRTAALQAGVATKPDDLLFAEGDQSREHQVLVSWPENLPTGEMAYCIESSDRKHVPLLAESGPIPRLSIQQPGTTGEAALKYNFQPAELAASGSQFVAEVLYRGHQFNKTFQASRIGKGLEIVHIPATYQDPTITVRGDARERSAVLFVFDCSSSMREIVKGKTRLNVARDTLNQILRQLDERHFDVGLIVYGHRAGWGPRENGKYTIKHRDPELHKAIKPGSDVELVLPLGKFTKESRTRVSNFLAPLAPHGETPLYLAICRAYEQMSSHPHVGIKRIIVITDGMNQQNEAGADLRNENDVTKIMDSAGSRDIKLDIVGFDFKPKTDEEAAFRFVQGLPAKADGEYYDANDASSLSEALERSLGLSQFEVLSAGRRAGEPRELGGTLRVEQRPGRKEEYTVRLTDRERPAETKVELQGGEAIELTVIDDAGQRQLVHQRYRRPRDVFQEGIVDPDPASSRKFYIAAHLPAVEGNFVRFEVSLQDSDPRQFMQRPAEAWLEVRPVEVSNSSMKPQVYNFYDMQLVPGRPVPVIGGEIPDSGNAEAEIRLWTKLEKTPPDEQIKLAQHWNKEFKLTAFPDATFKLEAVADDDFKVVITETHAAEQDLYSLKVELDRKADKIVHTYNPEIRSATHTFYFRQGDESLIRDYRAMFTSRKRLTEGAITTAEPLRRTIPNR